MLAIKIQQDEGYCKTSASIVCLFVLFLCLCHNLAFLYFIHVPEIIMDGCFMLIGKLKVYSGWEHTNMMPLFVLDWHDQQDFLR